MENKKEPPPAKVIPDFSFQIPQCCRENWKDCPHQVKKQKKVKQNIGL